VPTANANILTDPAATFAAYNIFGAKQDESGSEKTDAECGEWAGAEWPTEIDAQLIKINRWLVGSESAGIAGNTTTLLGSFALGSGSATFTVGDGSDQPIARLKGNNQSLRWVDNADTFQADWVRISGELLLRYSAAASTAMAIDLTTGEISMSVPITLYNRTDANRGAAGTAGRIIFNTDDGKLNIDDGTNWTLPDGSTT